MVVQRRGAEPRRAAHFRPLEQVLPRILHDQLCDDRVVVRAETPVTTAITAPVTAFVAQRLLEPSSASGEVHDGELFCLFGSVRPRRVPVVRSQPQQKLERRAAIQRLGPFPEERVQGLVARRVLRERTHAPHHAVFTHGVVQCVAERHQLILQIARHQRRRRRSRIQPAPELIREVRVHERDPAAIVPRDPRRAQLVCQNAHALHVPARRRMVQRGRAVRVRRADRPGVRAREQAQRRHGAGPGGVVRGAGSRVFVALRYDSAGAGERPRRGRGVRDPRLSFLRRP